MTNLRTWWAAARISSPFGAPRDGGKRKHRGTDWSHSTKTNTVDIPLPVGGKVVSKLTPASWHGFGHQVGVQTALGLFTFSHLPVASPLAIGKTYQAGTVLGREGTTGATSGPCVHVELQTGGKFVDPAPVILKAVGADTRLPMGLLKRGSKGVEVLKLQLVLNHAVKLGLIKVEELVRDQVFGPKVRAAVVALQAWGKVTKDGVYGAQTARVAQRVLDLVDKPATPPSPATEPVPAPDPEPTNPELEPEVPAPIEETEDETVPDSSHTDAERIYWIRRGWAWILGLVGGTRTLSDLGRAVIRTVVPAAWSWLLVTVSTHIPWLDWVALIPADIQAEIQGAVIVALAGVLYALIRAAARRWPSLEWLLGSPTPPTYTVPVADAAEGRDVGRD